MLYQPIQVLKDDTEYQTSGITTNLQQEPYYKQTCVNQLLIVIDMCHLIIVESLISLIQECIQREGVLGFLPSDNILTNTRT